MATTAQIATVKLVLPDEAVSLGVTDDIISSQIDAVGVTKTVLFSLRAIAAKIASVEDITESGSSRTQKFHDRLMLMITDWQARADAEDMQTGTLPPKMHAKLHTATRSDLEFPLRH